MMSERGLLLLLTCSLVAGCGNPAAPAPPSLHLPGPVTDLSAARIGSRVRLAWTMTASSTDGLVLHGDQAVEICRGLLHGPCTVVATTRRPPGQIAHADDTLPPALATGAPRLLRYQVRLLNRRGRSAGDSNTAYAAAGDAPPRASEVLAEPTAQGILVRWSATGTMQPPHGARLYVRLTRERVLRKGEAATSREETAARTPQPLTQTLEAPEQATAGGWSPQQVLDEDAELNRQYRYTVQLVADETVEGKPEQLAGEAATGLPVSAENTFPPPPPTGLAAAADPDAGAIDLSWTPSPGAAGYIVYRRAADEPGSPFVRVSGATPVSAPGWSDHSVRPGARYAYAVSAVNRNGGESSRSAPALEQLPQRQP